MTAVLGLTSRQTISPFLMRDDSLGLTQGQGNGGARHSSSSLLDPMVRLAWAPKGAQAKDLLTLPPQQPARARPRLHNPPAQRVVFSVQQLIGNPVAIQMRPAAEVNAAIEDVASGADGNG